MAEIAQLQVNTQLSHQPEALLQPLAVHQNQYVHQFQLFQVHHTIIANVVLELIVTSHCHNHHAAERHHAHLHIILYIQGVTSRN